MRLVVEREWIGGDRQAHFRPARRERPARSALIVATRSSGRVRETKMPSSPTICAPLRRRRRKSTPAMPGARLDRVAHLRRHPLRRGVEQGVDRAAAQVEAGDGDEQRDADGGQRVGVGQSLAGWRPGRPARAAKRRGRWKNAARRRPERRYRSPLRCAERAPAHEVDGERDDDRREGEGIGVDMRSGSPGAGAPEGDADREHEQEAGLRQRGDRLDLGVAERMVLVGGLVGLAHGKIGQ